MLPLVAAIASTLVGAAYPADLRTPTAAFSSGPVKVQSCQGYSIPFNAGTFDGSLTAGEISNLQISFVNQASVAATKVRFTIRTGARTDSVVDAGTFSKGVSITHDFMPEFGTDSAQCSVESVTFADGSSWTQS